MWSYCAGAAVSIAGPVGWVARQLWTWTAVLWIVAALWAFGGIGLSVVLTEATPSVAELAADAWLFVLGAGFLCVRACIATWESDLQAVGQRVSVIIFIVVVAVSSTIWGLRYINNKKPEDARLTHGQLLMAARIPLPPNIAPPPRTPSPSRPKIGYKYT